MKEIKMKKYKKTLIIVCATVIALFLIKQLYNWHKPYSVAKKLFVIDVPLAAKVKLFEQRTAFFDGSGETKIVFDVSNLKDNGYEFELERGILLAIL